MNMNRNAGRAAPRGSPALEEARRPSTRVSDDASRPAAPPGILDAARDQHDGLWIHYGSSARSLWVPATDFAGPEIFARLVNHDVRLVEPAAQRALRTAVADRRSYRPALVAASPGWVGHSFVLGNGDVLHPPNGDVEVIVAFQPHPKFAPLGTLASWQAAIGPIVARQPLAIFAVSLAFVGPLLPFVSSDYLSPLFEIVGAPDSGKSTLGTAAMSVWAGDRDSGSGGGETWNLTPGRFDAVKLSHRHTLLLLDEANLAGATLEARRQLIHHAVFGLTSTGPRQRMGDPPNKPHAQLAVLSTSNRPLSELIEGSTAERGAMLERMITCSVPESRTNGVLEHLPAGYASAAAAVEALRAAVDEHWGTAGPAFVRRLQRNFARGEEHVRAGLARKLALHRAAMSEVTNVPRLQKAFALVIVAGALAQRWGMLPAGWGNPAQAILSVAQEALRPDAAAAQGALARVKAYADRHRSNLIQVTTLTTPLTRDAFEAAPGFVRQCNGDRELLVPAQRFQAEFPDYRSVMGQLRREGKAQTEIGGQAKLTIKTPKAVCQQGRVYCILLSPMGSRSGRTT